MHTMTRKDFCILRKDEIVPLFPIILTHETEPIAIVCRPEDVVYLKDLHPRVQVQFRAMEANVRRGMPKSQDQRDWETAVALHKASVEYKVEPEAKPKQE